MLNSFLKALATGDNIRDFKHASRTFVDGNFRLSPKHKFLFHVVFQVNPGLGFTFSGSENTEASFLVKKSFFGGVLVFYFSVFEIEKGCVTLLTKNCSATWAN